MFWSFLFERFFVMNDRANGEISMDTESLVMETEQLSNKVGDDNTSQKDQKDSVLEFYSHKLENEKTYYILDLKWWKSWKKYVGFEQEAEGDPPQIIVNEHLFNDLEKKTLRKNLSEYSDYAYVQEEVWDLLKSW